MESGPTLAQVARALHRVAFSYWRIDPGLYELADWFFVCLAAIGGDPAPEKEEGVGARGAGGGAAAAGRIKLAQTLLDAALAGTLPITFPQTQDRDDFVTALKRYIKDQKRAA